jgi:predicted TIM-barrel fold metal-dependent hydrolase
MMISHADLPESDKRLIAGGNLQRLLGMREVSRLEPVDHSGRDEILAQARRGVPITSDLIIDAHGHLGPMRDYHVPQDTAQGIVRNLDLAGVDKILLSSLVAIQSDTRLGNDMVGEAVRKFPDRIVGYAVANPHFKGEIEAELTRCFDELRMSAIKIHPEWHQYPVDGENYQPVWDFASRHRAVVLSHTMGRKEEMAKFEVLSGRYPEITFILAHAGGSFQNAGNYIEISRKRSNVYLEVTLSSIPFGMIEHLVEGAGADKVLYGSDMTYRDHKPQLGWVVYSRIPQQDKRKVLGLNAARILGLRA